jgi:hypothetical protein
MIDDVPDMAKIQDALNVYMKYQPDIVAINVFLI